MRLPLLILHIVAGTVGLLAGTFAMSVRKGGRLHRASGNIFTVAMLTLASSALCLAIMKSQHGNIIGSIITTAWLAGRRRGIGRLDLAALLVGTGGAVAIITLGVWTLHHPDKNAPLPCASSWQPSSCSPPPETSACSLAAESPADRESRVTYGACASDSSSLRAPSSSASNRSFLLSCAAPSF
jgi:hypothetical protein